MFFRYRKYLESQVLELKSQLKEKEEKIDELVMALVPVLRRMNEPVSITPPESKKKHEIVRTATAAKCTCGWEFSSGDPAHLQNEIEEHHRENIHPIKAGRMSWQTARTKLEQNAESNNKEELA